MENPYEWIDALYEGREIFGAPDPDDDECGKSSLEHESSENKKAYEYASLMMGQKYNFNSAKVDMYQVAMLFDEICNGLIREGLCVDAQNIIDAIFITEESPFINYPPKEHCSGFIPLIFRELLMLYPGDYVSEAVSTFSLQNARDIWNAKNELKDHLGLNGLINRLQFALGCIKLSEKYKRKSKLISLTGYHPKHGSNMFLDKYLCYDWNDYIRTSKALSFKMFNQRFIAIMAKANSAADSVVMLKDVDLVEHYGEISMYAEETCCFVNKNTSDIDLIFGAQNLDDKSGVLERYVFFPRAKDAEGALKELSEAIEMSLEGKICTW